MKKLLVFLLLSLVCYSSEKLLEGIWFYESYETKMDIPYNNLSLKLNIDKNQNVKGSFIYVTRWGNKIEEPKNFTSKLKNDIFYISFDSDWGGKNGKVEITLNKDCSLDWNLIKEPDGEYYAPYKAHLVVNKLVINDLCKDLKEQRITLTQKTQLYKTPSEETITKMYLIAGDKADLLEEKTDEKGVKWYNILYHGKKDINAWIKADESINLEKEDK